MKDGELIAVDGRYQFAGDRNTGNCALRIAFVNFRDTAQYQCGYPRADFQPQIKSDSASLQVQGN